MFHSEELEDLPPFVIIPTFADKKVYLSSKSTFYRVLREEKEKNHSRAKEIEEIQKTHTSRQHPCKF